MNSLIHLFSSLLLALVVTPVNLIAQEYETGNWLMYFGTTRFSDKFSLHSELQYRDHTIAPINIEQLLLRAGLNFHFSDQALVTIGYGYIEGHVFESEQRDAESVEYRIWQQFMLIDNLGRVKFEHRYRIEQRWINNTYRNRFRYRLMLFVPLNKPQIEKGTLFIGLYDEVFVNGEKSFFDRNRLYGSLGYQVHKSIGIQIGILHQRLGDFGKIYAQLAIIFNADLRKKEKLKLEDL